METVDYLKFVLALVFVLGLIGVLSLLVRRYGFGMSVLHKRVGQRRLQVVEMTPIDARRRLVLVKRDDVEHLILLGAAGEIVIERDIQSGVSPSNELESTDMTKRPGDRAR